jgi:hypothetical protein
MDPVFLAMLAKLGVETVIDVMEPGSGPENPPTRKSGRSS